MCGVSDKSRTRQNMRKYMALIRVGIQKELVYRTNFCIGIFSALLLFIVENAIWAAVYQGKAQVGSISQNGILIYTVMTLLLQRLLGGGTEEEIGQDFQSGNIVTSLLSPVHLGARYSMQELGKGLLNAGAFLVILIPYCIYNREILSAIRWEDWLWFLSAVVAAYVLFSILNYMLGILIFWSHANIGLYMLKLACINIFSGMFIPIAFYPNLLQEVCQVLPFSYIYYFPLTILMGEGNRGENICGILIQLVWIMVLLVVCRIMDKRAMRRIVIQGG